MPDVAERGGWFRRYLRRLGVLVAIVGVVALASGLVAALAVDGGGVDLIPLAPLAALYSLGPVMAIVATVPLSRRGLTVAAVVISAALVLLWTMYVTSDSSTSALVFLLGWFIGIPVAAVVTIVVGVRARSRAIPAA